MTRLLSVAGVADLTGAAETTIRAAIESGALRARPLLGADLERVGWVVRDDVARRWDGRRPGRGRPLGS